MSETNGMMPSPLTREMVVQSNDIAGIVIDEIKKVWPDLFPILDFRYGIADAMWAAGYRKVADPE